MGTEVKEIKSLQETEQLSFEDVSQNETYEDIFFSDATTVVQDNRLLNSRPHMTKNEIKMFLTLVAAVGRGDDDLKNVKLVVSDIIGLWGISSNNAYEATKSALKGLLNKKFSLEYYREDGTRYIEMTTYISSFSYGQGDGYAMVKVDPMFKPYLIGLNKAFTQYKLKEALELDTAMAIRTFELLVQYENLGKRSFTVPEYKEQLGISDKYKGNNSNLKKYVLDKVVVEISKKTHILTRYELEGRGDNAKIHFDIYKKDNTIYAKLPEKNKAAQARGFGERERDLVVQLLKEEYDMGKDFSDENIKRAVDIATANINEKKEILVAYHIIVDALLEFRDRRILTNIEHPWAYFKKILEAKAEA